MRGPDGAYEVDDVQRQAVGHVIDWLGAKLG
jgi:hypothetical protein